VWLLASVYEIVSGVNLATIVAEPRRLVMALCSVGAHGAGRESTLLASHELIVEVSRMSRLNFSYRIRKSVGPNLVGRREPVVIPHVAGLLDAWSCSERNELLRVETILVEAESLRAVFVQEETRTHLVPGCAVIVLEQCQPRFVDPDDSERLLGLGAVEPLTE
jgi:hypothetical protein